MGMLPWEEVENQGLDIIFHYFFPKIVCFFFFYFLARAGAREVEDNEECQRMIEVEGNGRKIFENEENEERRKCKY